MRRLDTVPDLCKALQAVESKFEHAILLESARATKTPDGRWLGRYSFLTADPMEWTSVGPDEPAPLEPLRKRLSELQFDRNSALPPFQGGYAGLLSYELGRSFEELPAAEHDEFQIPSIAMGLYDVVLAVDHQTDEAWLISQGWKACGTRCHERAMARLDSFANALQRDSLPDEFICPVRTELSHSFEVEAPLDLYSNFDRESYIDAVQRAIDYIYAGDVFQINLAQRLVAPATDSSVNLYRRLRDCNPAPFGGYFDLGENQIVSASPERLVSVCKGVVETRPIKGTRRRTRYPEVDLLTGDDLLASEKDRAENVMIVDLMRNDLSRVCTNDSVVVTQLCELEQYESVIHLVSAIQGTLRPGMDTFDLIKAVFPGGSITGTPKVRSMEIISELENTARGAYCGSLGYIGCDGVADFNILIRTITASGGWWQIPVGGGIVSQSKPVAEYEETWTKAAGMLRAVQSSNVSDS
ncbi:MAG: anthranilate synthase component I family protein [Planctomycetota bacterium]